MQDLFRSRKFWLSLGVSLAVPFFAANAQFEDDAEEDIEDEEEVAVTWQEKRDEIKNFIDAEVDTKVRKQVSHEKIVAQIAAMVAAFETRLGPEIDANRISELAKAKKRWSDNLIDAPYPEIDLSRKPIPEWTWPISSPERSLEEIRESMEKKFGELFENSYKLKSVEELTEEAHRRYPLYTNIAERPRVSFKIRQGKGMYTKVEGKLTKLNNERLQVGGRWIIRRDLDDETASMFYKDVNDKFVADYVNDAIRIYRNRKESFIYDWVTLLIPEAFVQNGYVPLNYLEVDEETGLEDTNTRQSSNSKKWISRKEFEKKLYDALYNMLKEKLARPMEKEYFTHAAEKGLYEENFEFVTEANEWMPISVAQEYRDAKKREAEDKNRQDIGGIDDIEAMLMNR